MSWKIEAALTDAQSSAHAEACARGSAAYADPDAGLFVLTVQALERRGTCCGSACRHCPWDWTNVPSWLRDKRENMQSEGEW